MSNEELDMEEPEIIYIPDDEGNEEEFEVIMKFEIETGQFQGNKYMMVVPVNEEEGDDESESDEVYAFRYEEDGDDLQLYTIDNEQEWDEVEETFNTLVAELEQEEDA